MKANFKKASVFALAMALVLLMSLSVIPMVSAEEAAATTGTYYEIEQNYTKDFKETIGAMNISLEGKINLKLYYEGIGDSHDYIKVWLPGKDNYTTYQKEDLEIVDGRYLVEVPVNAAQQTELVKFQWVDTNGADGKWRSYSVRYYAGKIMDLAAGEDPREEVQKMDHTVKSMLNYGAMAQLRFGYKTDNLANEGLFDNSNPVDNMLVDHLYDATSNPTVDEFFLGTNVSLEDDIRMKVYVNAPEGTEVTINGSDKKTSVRRDANGTYVGIYNIPANQFANQFEIAVEGYETIYYSILGWCKSVLESYRTTEEEKDIAKALYQYYTWTTNYADDTYVPGPKEKDENGNPIIDQPLTKKDEEGNTVVDESGNIVYACAHERYYIKGENVVCSDCGENISATTRVSLVPTASSFIIDAENGTEVTFILSVVGSVDLKALSVTPVAEGLTLEATSIEVLEPHTQNVNGTAALNILLDAETAITESTQLAKITYNVKAATAGSYKITLNVNEALNDAEADVSEFIVPVTTILEAINPDCPHETKTGYDVTDAGHRWYCDICKQTGDWEAHTKANVWTPVLEAAGGKVTGELYETRNCTVCATAMEKRLVYYYNNVDSFKVNGTIVNPYLPEWDSTGKGNLGQTYGIIHHENPGYATFVLSPENFVDKDGNALVLKDTGTIGTGGWFGVNGGVARYVVKIDTESSEGKWQTYTSGSASTTKADDGGIGSALSKDANFTDDGRYTNSAYQSGLTFSDLEAYANQTVTVTLGAVPANNPGTEENPNVLITAVIENLFVECTHLSETYTWSSADKLYTFTCPSCDRVRTDDMLYKTEAITKAEDVGSTGNFLTATTKTEDGETFVRYTAGETTATDLYFYPYRYGTAVTGKYMVIKYRVSNGGTDLSTGQIFASSAPSGKVPGNSGTNQNSASSVWFDDGEWHTMIIQPKDTNTTFTPNEDGTISWGYLRININGIKAGNYVDIAEIAFADSEEAAKCYAYKNDSTVFFTNCLDFVKLDDVTTGSGTGTDKPASVDLSGKTITNAATSIKLGGWCVTPGGVASYKLRVTSIDGEAVDNPALVDWVKASDVTADNAVTGQGTNRGFTTNCRLGARYYETAVNLSAWAGHTINFEIVAVTNYGAEVTIVKINNVTLP